MANEYLLFGDDIEIKEGTPAYQDAVKAGLQTTGYFVKRFENSLYYKQPQIVIRVQRTELQNDAYHNIVELILNEDSIQRALPTTSHQPECNICGA